MKRIIFALFVLLIGAFIGIALIKDPGYFFIRYNHWTLQTSFWFGLFGLLFLFICLHSLFSGLKWLCRLPQKFRIRHQRRKLHQAQAMTQKGLIAFSEGYFALAKKQLLQALPALDMPLINYLVSARAAQELGDSQDRDACLREAKQAMPDTEIAVELTQAQLQMAEQQWEQALATLKHLQATKPKHPHVLKLLLALYQKISDWPQVMVLLPQLKKEGLLSSEAYTALMLTTVLQQMTVFIKEDRLNELTAFFEQLPKDLKKSPRLLTVYLPFLIKKGQLTEAESLLKAVLKKQFDDQLIAVYGQFSTNAEQIHFVEQFLKKYPNSAALYLTLGQLCIAQQLWGKAQAYLEKSIQLKPSTAAYIQMALFHEHFLQTDKACAAYKKALINPSF